MKIKDITVQAFKKLGREDLASAVGADGELTAEGAEKCQTLLYCISAVEDELARYYFPLKTEQTLTSFSGKYEFTKLKYRPVKILSVTENGKAVPYSLNPEYLSCGATRISVEYEYSPAKKTLADDSAYDGVTVSENLIANGAAAEYCLLNGEAQMAETWESRYRFEIDRARKKSNPPATIPPRRWV